MLRKIFINFLFAFGRKRAFHVFIMYPIQNSSDDGFVSADISPISVSCGPASVPREAERKHCSIHVATQTLQNDVSHRQ